MRQSKRIGIEEFDHSDHAQTFSCASSLSSSSSFSTPPRSPQASSSPSATANVSPQTPNYSSSHTPSLSLPLPRLSPTASASSSSSSDSQASPLPIVLSVNAKGPPPLTRTVTIVGARKPVQVHWSYLLWASFMSLVGGTINGISLSGVFDSPATHMTGFSSNMAIRWLRPPKGNDVRGPSITGWWYLLFMMCFVAGSFAVGAVLIERDRDENNVIIASKPPRQLTMDSPKIHRWKTTHQIVLTIEMGLLLLSMVIVSFVDEGVVDSIDAHQQFNRFLMSLCLVCSASGIHNSMTTYCRTLPVRSTHVTGTLTDIGMILGFAMRTRQKQHLWKLKLLIPSWISFVVGVTFGALTFYATDDYAIFLPLVLLSPLWFWGLWNTNFYGLKFHWVRRMGLNTPQIAFGTTGSVLDVL